jgi:hypothetical protein
MAKVIIGIHGLANKPERGTQAQWWVDSIKEGLQKNCKLNLEFNFDDVYWADLLYEKPLHRNPDFSFDSLYDDEPYVPAKAGALKKYDEGFMDELRADSQSLLGGALDAVKSTLGVGQAADFVLQQKLKDLAFYYDPGRRIKDRSGRQRPAREVLQEDLEKTLVSNKAHEIMLIAHSMGSIIAYDVLRKLGQRKPDPGARVSHFVTIGSPLGLPHVKLNIEKVHLHDPQVRTPTIVTRSWVNFADRKDPVAFDTHLEDDYGPNDSGVAVKDDLILNDYEMNGKANHHKLFGYLRAPEVSEHIRDFLNS